MALSDEIIDLAEVSVAPRGRKADLDKDLVAAFANLPDGKAIRLAKKFGKVAREDRAKVGQTIRKNWKAARPAEKCRINFGTDGVPQVSANGMAEA
jgi:hypothetical protein